MLIDHDWYAMLRCIEAVRLNMSPRKETIFEPFGWRALAWAGIVEAAVRSGAHIIDLPDGYSFPYSVLAGQTIEATRIAFQRSLIFLSELSVDDLPEDVPPSVRPYLTTPIIKEACEIISAEESKWVSKVNQVLKANPLGMRAGVKPIHLL
ncbi:hypothetical protein [Paracoccus sp. NSM]|uniref:hypothetical protein n=1 Tax=Paracoccus sp. NSM TaxID=3457784 RepID=UPI0040362C24